MNCPLYNALDWFKRTRACGMMFYYGQQFRRKQGIISVVGETVDCIHDAVDGDECFDMIEQHTGLRWHCETTSCQPPKLREMVQRVKKGLRVVVIGHEVWDPPHHIPLLDRIWKGLRWQGGGNEVHPVLDLTILGEGE